MSHFKQDKNNGFINSCSYTLHGIKAQLDINFLINCKSFGVFLKFINVYLPNVVEKDMYEIKKKLQKNALHKQIQETNDVGKNIKNLELQIKQRLNNFDWYILVKLLKTHQKKIRNLTKRIQQTCSHTEK